MIKQQEVLIRNRSYNGDPGYHILTPLILDNGKALLVERGWIPTNLDKLPTKDIAPPKGKVEVTGVLLPEHDQPQGWIGAKDPQSGKLSKVFWVDIERLQPQINYTLEPAYLRLVNQNTAQNTLLLPLGLGLPTTENGPHLGYALQWFAFTIILLVVYVLLMRNSVTSEQS